MTMPHPTTKPTVSIFLSSEGQERIAAGDYRLYSWELITRPDNKDGTMDTPKNCLPIAVGIEITLPSTEIAGVQAVAALRERKQQVLADAHAEAIALEQRIGKLLALSYSPNSAD